MSGELAAGNDQLSTSCSVFGEGPSNSSGGSECPPPIVGPSIRSLVAASVFFALLGAWSWTNRVEFDAGAGDLAALRVVEVGRDLLMISERDERWVLADGFGLPEADGTWIVELDSRIILKASGDSPRKISLKVYPFVAGAVASRELEVRSSEASISATLTEGVHEIVVPLDGHALQVVEITCSSVDSPLKLGVGTDLRPLCAKLLSVRLDAD